MKTIPTIICLLLLLYVPRPAQAAFTENANASASLSNTVATESQLLHQLQALSFLSRKDYEQLTGQHLGLAGRVLYQIQRHRLQNELKEAVKSGTAPLELLKRYLTPVEKRRNDTGRTIAIVLLTILILFLVLLLVLLGKWKG